MDNTNTPSIFLQLMKAIYTNDKCAFESQRKALYDNLDKQTQEIADHYQRLTGTLAMDFLDLFLTTTDIEEEEVRKMAITMRELLKVDEILERGREEGREEEKIEMVRNLLQEGLLTQEQIARVTKLSIAKINEIELSTDHK